MLDVNHIKEWKKALFFSFISYSMVLFAIIVIDVFWRQDFNFKEIAMIAGAYIGLIIFFTIISVMVFKIKLDSGEK